MRESLLYSLPDVYQRAQYPVHSDETSCQPDHILFSGVVNNVAVWCVAGEGLYISDIRRNWAWCIKIGRRRKDQVLVRQNEQKFEVIVADDRSVTRWFVEPQEVEKVSSVLVGGRVEVVYRTESTDTVIVGRSDGKVGSIFWSAREFIEWKSESKDPLKRSLRDGVLTPGKRVLSLFSRMQLSPQSAEDTGNTISRQINAAVADILQIGDKIFVLHVDGAIGCYTAGKGGVMYLQHVAKLALKLTGDTCMMIEGGQGIVCIVSVDESPHGDSLRAIEVVSPDHSGGEVILNEIAIDKSPFDGAVVGGHVIEENTGKLRVMIGLDNGRVVELGTKGKVAWTALDDLHEYKGSWKSGDAGANGVQSERLLCPGRFSTNSLVKSLRLKDRIDLTRSEVEEAVRMMLVAPVGTEDDESAIGENRNESGLQSPALEPTQLSRPNSFIVALLSRAERIASRNDKYLTSLRFVVGIGIVCYRADGVYVMRLTTAEEQSFLSLDAASMRPPHTDITPFLADSAYSQIISCRVGVDEGTRHLAVWLSQKASQTNQEISLATVVGRFVRNTLSTTSSMTDSLSTLLDVVDKMHAILRPGARLLTFLQKQKEFDAVPRVSEVTVNNLPASTLYMRALAALDRKQYNDAFACFVHSSTIAAQTHSSDLELLSSLLTEKDGIENKAPLQYLVLQRTIELLKNEGSTSNNSKDDSKRPMSKTEAKAVGDDKYSEEYQVGEAISAAAAAAIEAMKVAPTLATYERMRASAFTLYLSLQPPNIEGAVASIMKPVRSDLAEASSYFPSVDDRSAVQDAISLLTTVCLPRSMSFLTNPPMPTYMQLLVLPSLWNLARSTDPLPASEEVSPYMYLYAYLLHLNDPQSAASAALELSARIQALPYHPDGTEETDHFELLRCAKGNTQALSMALTAARLLGSDDCSIELSGPTQSIIAGLQNQADEDRVRVVVDAHYIRRRLLLAAAVEQLEGNVAGTLDDATVNSNYITWIARALLSRRKQWMMALELIAVWVDSVREGSAIFQEMIADSTHQEVVMKGWEGAANVLQYGDDLVRRYHLLTNKALGVAAVEAGLRLGGAVPQWLEVRASREDLGMVCHLYVQRARPLDAARILVQSLESETHKSAVPLGIADGVSALLTELSKTHSNEKLLSWKQKLNQKIERYSC